MFTRFDMERNRKAMRKGLATHTVDPQKYQNIVKQMTEYVSLPERYFRQVVYSYLWHCNLKTVYAYLTPKPTDQTGLLNESHYATSLAKLAALHRNKLTQWSTHQASLSKYRRNIAMTLTSNLESLETDTGLLLIKPVYWHNNKTNCKLKEVVPNRTAEDRGQHLMNEASEESGFNEYSMKKLTRNSSLTNPDLPTVEDIPTLNSHFYKITGQEGHLMATTSDMELNTNSVAMWTPSNPRKQSPSLHRPNTPITANDNNNNNTSTLQHQQPVSVSCSGPLASKIQELDINTMLVCRNNVFTDLQSKDDHQGSKLYSYYTVRRPTMPLLNDLIQETSSIQPQGLQRVAFPSPLSRPHSLSMSSNQNLFSADSLVPKPGLSKSSLPPISSLNNQQSYHNMQMSD
ncbi:uncharacterized protein LOC106873340 isoform X2 [Octopus bimaculoides]|uniref:Uncharacterized protein n=1 Tax=Octopus bimaculoides TaxID=37653 RepID=A0A0L8H1Q2_OCTBM|nr:uncharacterized protein LOC106873340 isoform X2 [Octopus bimaculoides]|eukprot:XP_014776152.1 PREDICTED: uncharacterized protein LOC106873340 isoform X2 [Octopus bimaculoides]